MVIPIPMSGPFHSMFMKQAADRLRKVLDHYSFSPLVGRLWLTGMQCLTRSRLA